MKILELPKKNKKEWTILIYANGNNDLEPEITKAILDIESIGSGVDINIVMQIGRASKKIVNSIRRSYKEEDNRVNKWHGVRRYLVDSKQSNNNYIISSKLLEDLGNINMAKSRTLDEFITWGIENFKAARYALIILGHGSGYMGVCHDFSQRLPNIMTIYGLRRALENSMIYTGKLIDVLIFDSCYMNTIEVLYELAMAKKSPRLVITPELSPLEGLPYKNIIEIFKSKSNEPIGKLSRCIEKDVNIILKNEKSKLYTYRLNKILFYMLKKCINSIAKNTLENRKIISSYIEGKYEGYPFVYLSELISTLRKEKIGITFSVNILMLKKIISFIIINKYSRNSLTIFLIDYDYYKLTKVYYKRMLFNKDNSWINLLGNNEEESLYDNNNLILQEDMSLNSLYYIISLQNPGLNKTQVYHIIKELGWLKCPKLENIVDKNHGVDSASL